MGNNYIENFKNFLISIKGNKEKIGSGIKNKDDEEKIPGLEDIIKENLINSGFTHVSDLSSAISSKNNYKILDSNDSLKDTDFITKDSLSKINTHYTEQIKKIEGYKKNFVRVSKIIKSGQNKDKEDVILQVGEFISQPNSSNNSPDFILKVKKDLYVGIESKSLEFEKKSFMFNAHIPSKSIIYIFGFQDTGKILFFKGDSIISEKLKNFLDGEIRKKAKDFERNLELEIKDKSKDEHNIFGLTYYGRFATKQLKNMQNNKHDINLDLGMTADEIIDSMD